MKYPSWKNTLKSWFLCKIPFFSKHSKSNIFIWRPSLKFYHTVIWIISWLKIILWCLLFIIKIWVKNVEFISLYSFRWRIIFCVMKIIIFVPLTSNPDSINTNWLLWSKISLSFTRNPIIKIFFILFHSFVPFKFNNLFCNLIISVCLLCNNISTQQTMIMRNWQIYL